MINNYAITEWGKRAPLKIIRLAGLGHMEIQEI